MIDGEDRRKHRWLLGYIIDTRGKSRYPYRHFLKAVHINQIEHTKQNAPHKTIISFGIYYI